MHIYLLTDAIYIWILQVLKKGGVYREYACFLQYVVLGANTVYKNSLVRHEKIMEFP